MERKDEFSDDCCWSTVWGDGWWGKVNRALEFEEGEAGGRVKEVGEWVFETRGGWGFEKGGVERYGWHY